MVANKYIKSLFKVIYRYMFILRFITYLMLIHAMTGLVDRYKLNFDQSFLQFTVKKKIYTQRGIVK